MGQSHASGNFGEAAVKEAYGPVRELWLEEDLAVLIDRLKGATLNFSLDNAKFVRLLQLSVAYEDIVGQWFVDFSQDRANKVVDGLEFLAASIMVSTKVAAFRKIHLMYTLFDLDRSGAIRKDEFTIFLKAVTTGLHRMVTGLPPPATIAELGALSKDFFSTLGSQALSRQDLFMWMTEAHFSMHYLSVLTRLGQTIFAWGLNHRHQLGLDMEPKQQRIPSPMLALEGIRIVSVASGESHSLFRTEHGQVWSCGSGFSGILGHGSTEDCRLPRLVETLVHTKVIDVSVGVRHSVAISSKGQVFTWGSADMGQLGHGSIEDREVHEWAFDPKSGGQFAYVSKPTVVMCLFGKRVQVRKSNCSNFSTMVLTDQGQIYTWGNNTDGQCGQGQQCSDHHLIFVDPHMQRTAMQVLVVPRLLDVGMTFHRIAAGGYHMLAVDREGRIWSWGKGLWGVLGNGSQRTAFEPKIIDSLKHHSCHGIVAGESHSMGLCSLYRLTITGTSESIALSPFSLLGLPTGRIDRHIRARQPTSPPNTTLELNAFASAPLMQVILPYRFEPDQPLLNPAHYSTEEIRRSIVLMDRTLWEGEWLKIETSDFDFKVAMSTSGAALPPATGTTGLLMFGETGKWEPMDCAGKICVFECPPQFSAKTRPEEVVNAVLEHAAKCQQSKALACLLILPKHMDLFTVQAGSSDRERQLALSAIPFGIMSHEHGMVLKKHIIKLVDMRIAQADRGIPEEVMAWSECHEEASGKISFLNASTGETRLVPPQICPQAQATLVAVKEDSFLQRLKAMTELRPKGIIVCQQSWRPDVELVILPDAILETLDIPIVMVTYEAGEELKSVASAGSFPWVTMEIQPYGGLFAWGNGTSGQLGLAGIENQSCLTTALNNFTGEQNSFAHRPYYIAHLHEHQVTTMACGRAHTIAVTQQGEVYTWGAAAALGVPLDKPFSGVPMFVEQLDGMAKATKAYAGHYHSFVVADLPHKSIV